MMKKLMFIIVAFFASSFFSRLVKLIILLRGQICRRRFALTLYIIFQTGQD
jgi:hypothetical protein